MKIRLNLEIHTKKEEIINVMSGVTIISWYGDIKSPSRTLEFELLQSSNDAEIETLGISEGDTVSFFINEEERFRGILIDIERKSNSNTIRITSKDIGFLLAKNKLAFNFTNKKTEDVARDVIKKLGYKIGVLAKTGQKYTKVITGSSGYEIIQARYTEASKVTGKKYMTYAHKDMYYTIEKGEEVLRLQFNEGENIFSSSYKISLENMINKLVVVDGEGNEISKEVDKETLDLYKITIQEIKKQQENGTGEMDNISLKKPEKTASLVGIGNPTCICGKAVTVKDSFTGLVGKFYIDSDKHTWSGGNYEVELGLNFENIMDEHEIAEQTTIDGENVYGSGGELIGKKVKALFTAYCPKLGGINGGNETASGERIDYSKKTCAGPQQVKMQSNIQVLGTGTQYDGQIYRKNDHGGKIKIVNGVYHFDLLMDSGSKTSSFGRRNGYAIIGAPGTPKFASSGGGNSRAVQLAKSKLGKPYKWGATGPNSFDCSGLIYWVAKQMGKSIPRTSREQSDYGQSVSKNALIPGDCVFFGSPVHHVGMYIGGGNFIHAPQTGDVVKITPLSSRRDFHNARRFL